MFSLCKKSVRIPVPALILIPFMLMGTAWKGGRSSPQVTEWVQKCISASFNPSKVAKLKKWDLNINGEGFLRLRKYYTNGKQEYFSFNLSRLHTMLYFGTVASGDIIFKTKSDDIIVQTYNDRKGNIDSMATLLRLPVTNMEPERLDTLNRYLDEFR